MSAENVSEKTESCFDMLDDEAFCAVEGHIGFDSVKAARERKDEIEEKMLTISIG
ncbi:hypothetical protein [Geovibrio thiophilus]|uniref:hypothetical protein n=1 Tax=Geovibrio thiophilus TaxID=139438 RepID=UPI0013E306F2|nr:hypothetical protein [Geovibrio thiophilus]